MTELASTTLQSKTQDYSVRISDLFSDRVLSRHLGQAGCTCLCSGVRLCTPPVRPRLMRRMPGEVLDELLTLVRLLPWLATHSDSPLAHCCNLSDATLKRGAVVKSRLSLAASVALWRMLSKRRQTLAQSYHGGAWRE
eukprot:5802760-Amphidinium_carterae.2